MKKSIAEQRAAQEKKLKEAKLKLKKIKLKEDQETTSAILNVMKSENITTDEAISILKKTLREKREMLNPQDERRDASDEA